MLPSPAASKTPCLFQEKQASFNPEASHERTRSHYPTPRGDWRTSLPSRHAVTVGVIVGQIAAGQGIEQILADYS